MKLKLQENPTFVRKVEIPAGAQGEAATLSVTYKYMPKAALAEFLDAVRKEGRWWRRLGYALGALPVVGFIFRRLFGAPKSDAQQLAEVIEAWSGDVDLPFDLQSAAMLAERYPAAVRALIGEWAAGLAEARSGN